MNRQLPAAAALLGLVLAGGCVERKLTITSEPAGALVFFANDEIGRTPLTVPFTFYGDRDVILRLEGYQTLKTSADLQPPLYDIPPWDLVSQALVPWTYHYHAHRHYVLSELELSGEEQLIERAHRLKGETFKEGTQDQGKP